MSCWRLRQRNSWLPAVPGDQAEREAQPTQIIVVLNRFEASHSRGEQQMVDWSIARELAQVARKDGQKCDCATWLDSARELRKKYFNAEVSKHLTGKGTEAWEIL